MESASNIRRALCDLIPDCSADVTARIAMAITPDPTAAPKTTASIATAARQGREACRSLVQKQSVVERLSEALGKDSVESQEIESVLNQPFPTRTPISVEFLDLLVARIQQLESTVKLLSGLVIELRWPSEHVLPEYVSASSGSTDRR